MKNASLILLLIIPISVFSQWRYVQTNDDFEGIYRYSEVVGKGYDRTYDDPTLILRKYKKENSFDLYIDDAGYFTTNSKNNILIKFDNEDIFYLTEGLPSKDRSALFIYNDIWKGKIGGEQINRIELLEKMMKGSKISVRLKTDYKTYDINFSLSGSTKAINYVLPNINDEIKKLSDFRIKQENERLIKEQKLNSVFKKLFNEKIDTTSLIYNDLLKHFTEITNSKFETLKNEDNILDSVSLTNLFDIYNSLDFYSSIQLVLHFKNRIDINYIDYAPTHKKYEDFLINFIDKRTFSLRLKNSYSDYMKIYLDSSFNFDRNSSFTNNNGNQWFFNSNKGTLSLEYVSEKNDFKLESSKTKRKFINKSFRKIDELVVPYQNGYEGVIYHFKKKNDHKFVFCVNLKLNHFFTLVFEPNPKFINDLNFVNDNYFNFYYDDN
tara:strand:- start:1181 stop:2491 length:1311 start_codon:yes stop_codon:yes gene_type:complete